MASPDEIRKRLRATRQRERRLEAAVERLADFKDFARRRHLPALRKWADRKIEDLRVHTLPDLRARIRELEKRLEDAIEGDVPPVVDGGWHPRATRTQVQSGIGAYLSVPARLVWHTTEGSGLPAYSGSHPHFTLNPQTGALYQHIDIRSGAMALRNLEGGVETNRARAIQVELIGFAAASGGWSDEAYRHIAELARWIEKHAGVARASSVRFGGAGNLPSRLSGQAWLDYRGHLGHQHVPENDHWDPGAFKIDKVI